MTTKLLLGLSLFSVLSYAQSDIMQFQSTNGSNYAIVDIGTPVDETIAGANLTWNFTTLTQTGTNVDTYAAPSTAQGIEFPGTTTVLTITTQGNPPDENLLLLKIDGNGTSITGADQAGNGLNYVNNAFIGNFPLSFGDTNSDTVSGSFSGQADGTFTGTITSTVDAHGTLNMNDIGSGAYNGTVTRLKTVQNLTISLGFFNGTLVQTTYNYYDDSTSELVLRSSTITVSVPFVGDNTSSVLESYIGNTLSTSSSMLADLNQVKIYPNPATNKLYIEDAYKNTIQHINITDVSGRTIYSSNTNTSQIDISQLVNGAYFLTLKLSDGRQATKQFIKQ